MKFTSQSSKSGQPGNGRLILSFAPNRWHGGKWTGRHFVTRELARQGHTVVYVESPEYWSGRIDFSRRTGVEELEPRFYRFSFPSFIPRFDRKRLLLNRVMSHIRMQFLKRWLQGLPDTDVVLYVWHPDCTEAIGRIDAKCVCYHKYDRYPWTGPREPEDIERERQLVKRSDVRISLTREMIELGEDDALFEIIPSAADVEAFDAARRNHANNEPVDLEGIPGPRLAYVGAINQKVDYSLLRMLADHFSDYSIVLIGPRVGELERFDDELSELTARPNVYHLGGKSFEELPSYMVHLDVGLVCYRLDRAQWTQVCSPLKMYEYLAADLPVVSVDIPAARQFPSVVSIARSEQEWIAAIEASLTGRDESQEARLMVARENSWASRARRISELIDGALGSA